MKQVIQRFEKKYLLDADQCRSFVMRIQPYITEDIYPASTIYNLYLDTEQFDLIHRSIEKPPFKEKLRIRSYTPVCSEEEPIYLEIKAERSYPLWLSSVLSDMRLYPTSFSKVGQVFYKKEKGELLCLQAS